MLNKRQTSFPKTHSSGGFPPSLPSSSAASTSRFRVHSAPPTSDGRPPLKFGRLPPIMKNNSEERAAIYLSKPSTPDPEQVRRVLEQRIAQALSGPSSQLKQQQTSSDEQFSTPFGRRRSLIRSAAIGSEEMHLVPVDDEELSMLRSINRSHYSKGSVSSTSNKSFSSEALYKHEYEDKSSDEEVEREVVEQLKNRRKLSMVRQEEQEDELAESVESMNLAGIQSRRESGIRNMEDRLTGMRHEKMRSSTKSGENPEDDQISGLVYDKEFDCYYNPNTDRYYRLKSQSKSGDGLIFQPREL